MSIDKLNKLIREFQGDIEIKDGLVENINSRTNRVVRPEDTAKNGEFTYRDGSPVKEGTSYHIHYTDDLNEYYMTGVNHDKDKSLVILPTKAKTNFSIYNNLNKQSKLSVKVESNPPTDSDYSTGYVKRVFARKTNEKQTPVFEVNKNAENVSPLYDYVSVIWTIVGKKEKVFELNSKEIEKAAEILPSITKFLSPLQYYRMTEAEETKEDILAKLGIQTVGPDTQQTDSQSTTTSTTSTSAAGSGGSYSGGSGGSGGGGSGGGGGGSGGGGGY